jgi:hypothetical protein
MARLEHARQAHPRAMRKRFLLTKNKETKEANRKTVVAGLMRRITAAKSLAKHHDWIIFQWPCGIRKNRNDVACKTCGHVARSIQQLHGSKCKPLKEGELGFRARLKQIEKIKKEREKATDKEPFARILQIMQDALVWKEAGEEAVSHNANIQFTALPKHFRDWKGQREGLSSLRWICDSCKRTAGQVGCLRRQPCEKLTARDLGYWNRIRVLQRIKKKSKKICNEMCASFGVAPEELSQKPPCARKTKK